MVVQLEELLVRQLRMVVFALRPFIEFTADRIDAVVDALPVPGGHEDRLQQKNCAPSVATTFVTATPVCFARSEGMPTERIAIHKIGELLRPKYEFALSHERIGRALSISKGVVAKYDVNAAEASELSWDELPASDEAALRAHPGSNPRGRGASAGYVMPNLAAVHQELKKKQVTLALLWEEWSRRSAPALRLR